MVYDRVGYPLKDIRNKVVNRFLIDLFESLYFLKQIFLGHMVIYLYVCIIAIDNDQFGVPCEHRTLGRSEF